MDKKMYTISYNSGNKGKSAVTMTDVTQLKGKKLLEACQSYLPLDDKELISSVVSETKNKTLYRMSPKRKLKGDETLITLTITESEVPKVSKEAHTDCGEEQLTLF